MVIPFCLFAKPVLDQAVVGPCSISQSGDKMIIQTERDRSILHWKEFSVGTSEQVTFNQLSKHSVVLNRIIGENPTQILGRVDSNGHLILINPHGVLIGKEGTVNAASFIASSLDILDRAFLNKEGLVFSGISKEKVVNLGKIKTWSGDALLIGYQVENAGEMVALEGTAGVLAGQEVLIRPTGEKRILLHHKGNQGYDSLKDEIEENGNPYALAFKHDSEQATGVLVVDGKCYLVDPAKATVTGSMVSKFEGGKGGEILALGEAVEVSQKGCLDATGDFGGGKIKVGAISVDDPFGATTLFVGSDATLDASALKEGDGGDVFTFSNLSFIYHGRLIAHGGQEGGNGGRAEISGKGYIENACQLDLLAPKGKKGALFFDPLSLEIGAAATSNASFIAPNVFPTGAGAVYNSNALESNLGGADVYVITAGGGVGAGDITFTDDVIWGGIGTSGNLYVLAHNNIRVDNNISAGSGISNPNMTFVAGWDGFTTSGFGSTPSSYGNNTNGNGADFIFQPTSGSLVKSSSGAVSAFADNFIIGGGGATIPAQFGSDTGTIHVTTKNDILVTGSIPANAYALIGAATTDTDADFFINAGRDVIVNASSGGDSSYAGIGQVFVDHSKDGTKVSNITVNAGRNITITGGSNLKTLAQIGHSMGSDDGADLTITGNISVTSVGPVTIRGGSGEDSLAMIGIGGPENGNDIINGNVSVVASNFDLRGGSGDYAGAAIGFYSTQPVGTVDLNSTNVRVETFSGNTNYLVPGSGLESHALIGALIDDPGPGHLLHVQNVDVLTNSNLVMSGLPAIGVTVGAAAIQIDATDATPASQITVRANNIDMRNNARILNLSPSGSTTVIANQNLQMNGSASAAPSITNIGTGDTNIVVDNAFPNFPNFGTGSLVMDANSVIDTGGVLRIFSSQQSQNSIQGLLNGVSFAAGPFLQNTSSEQWGFYFNTVFGGTPFTVFYKLGLQLLLLDSLADANLAITEYVYDLRGMAGLETWWEEFEILFKGDDKEEEKRTGYFNKHPSRNFNNPRSHTSL